MHTKQEERSLKLVVDFYDALINKQQYSRASEFLDKNYIQHRPGVENGPEGVINFLRSVYANSPNHKAEIVRSFVDGDYVILHVHVMNGLEAKDIAVIDIFRVDNGIIMEHWDVTSPVPATEKNKYGVF